MTALALLLLVQPAPTVWPNAVSRANGDPWLATHHDRITELRPKLLLVNFSNEHSRDQCEKLAGRIIAALAESSRPHGYRDPAAKPVLRYEVFKFVDLRDADRTTGDSRLTPLKNPAARTGFNMRYAAFFGDEFAKHFGVPDPKDRKRFLRLDELIDAGLVHEVWFFGSGNEKDGPHVGAFEVVERKPRYDLAGKRVGAESVQAGNGGDDDQPWTGRSVRIGCINASRGPGCFLESLAHGFEAYAKCGSLPYLQKYLREYCDFDLTERYGLPLADLYAVDCGVTPIRYPDDHTAVFTHQGKEQRVEGYRPRGGSAHFPPNARRHYDLDNSQPVQSTIEGWRQGGGRGGADVARPFTNAAFRNYRDLAPDCMGAWLVYWRQNMPGPRSKAKDDDGKPVKSFWPYLFY